MTRPLLLALIAIAFGFSLVNLAQAQTRVFVGITGSDGNPCTSLSPCRTFQHAHDVVPANGEIDVLDPAGYGPLTISKAISIQGHGFSGISVPSGGIGITINASSTAAVMLNGVIIDGAGVGYDGIVFNSGGSLTIANCVVRHFVRNGSSNITGNGILIQPTTGLVNFAITDTMISNNDYVGIFYLPPSGSSTTSGVVDHVVATSNQYGIALEPLSASGGTANVTISNSTVSNNFQDGIITDTSATGTLSLSIDNVSASNNGLYGILAQNASKVLLGRSVITGNGFGISNLTAPNTFYTYIDNRFI